VSTSPSLYRRHRPRTFAEVVGQEHVVRTLSNAVTRDMVHHAYLFVGSRGTGKTSMAKILAACLNCQDAPTITPCGTCDSCRSIASATSLDVIEMDAASSNSVDDIRALRESVAYAPVSGGQKVYILDEAHMLSTAAWNAFLKTLEEPPPRTIFVLATTEAQKVLPTVVDRCHRFDFHRPTADQIATVLRRTALAESIDVPPAAVALLARHAAGSFRDALGTLEQLRTYSGPTILLEDVLAVLGVADAELLAATLDAVNAGDPRRALQAVAGAIDSGRDPAGFVRELEAHVREVLVVQTLGLVVPPEIAVTPERDEQISDQATRIPAPTLVRLLDLLAAALAALRTGADGRTQLELAIIKAARPALDASTDALLERIARLEAALSSLTLLAGPGSPAGHAGPAGDADPVANAAPGADDDADTTAGVAGDPSPAQPSRPSGSREPAPSGLSARPAASPEPGPPVRPAASREPGPPAPTAPPIQTGPATASEPDLSGLAAVAPAEPDLARLAAVAPAEPDLSRLAPGDPAVSRRPAGAPAGPDLSRPPATPPADAGRRPLARPPAPPPADHPIAGSLPAPDLQAPDTAPEQKAPTLPALPSPEPLTIARILALWPAVLDAVGTTNRMLAAVVADAIPVELTDHRLVLAFPADGEFLRRKADDSANRVAVAEALRTVTGRTLTLAYDLRELAPPAEPPATPTNAEWVARLKVEFDAHELDA
jgi:DNA polymerase III subunit gamma/tau